MREGREESSSTLQGMRSFSAIESSIAAVNGSGAMIAYSAAMAAVSGMTLPLARSLGRYGIRCVGIQPGLFAIPEIRDYEDTINVLAKMTPFPRRLGDPEEFAQLVEVRVMKRVNERRLYPTKCLTAATFVWTGAFVPSLFVRLPERDIGFNEDSMIDL